MAGKRHIYEKAIKKGHNYAWDKAWNEAIAEYKRALAEFPDDAVAYTSLGWAYLQSKNLEEALGAYLKASQLSPDDPAALERLADVQERLGRLEEAAETYMAGGELYARRQETQKAIDTWLRVTRLAPDHLAAHERLAEAYAQAHDPQKAVKEYLTLARLFQRRGEVEKAAQQCRLANKLDPHHAEVHATMESLRSGEVLTAPSADVLLCPPLGLEETASEDEEESSPAAKDEKKAIDELVALVFGPEDAPTDPAQIALISQAVNAQTMGEVDEAIDAYRRAIKAGVDRPASHYNLGLLYKEKMRFGEAINEFKLSVQAPEYALGSHFALGECYRAQGQIDDALEHFIEALKIVDLNTVQRDHADDLIHLYESLADSYAAKGDPDSAVAFMNSLEEFLGSKGWEDKAQIVREHLDRVSEEGVIMSLAEVLEVADSDAVLSSMARIQEYLKRNMVLSAMEECYWAIEKAPFYLPLHLRLSEVFMSQDRNEEAITKYLAVADVYHIRGDARQAIGIYKRVLRVAPMDVGVRSKLIDLLISYGEIDQALKQYMTLADTYFQFAQVDRALEKYKEALRLAPRATEDRMWKVRILHRMGDIYMQRIDWRQATAAYEEIKALSPGDEKARIYLVDLYHKRGRVQDSLTELDELLDLYRADGKPQNILSVLKEIVQLRPDDMAVHDRLVQAYLEQGKKEEAVAQLDALGAMQLEAGQREQALKTIRRIIELEPEGVDSYRQLLAEQNLL